jgi:CheY-like chemotaxis protein
VLRISFCGERRRRAAGQEDGPRLLEGQDDVVVVAEREDGDALAGALEPQTVDVIVLDARMPGKDVFEVLDDRARRAPADMPAVIFTTAYERYAVRAFELNAADYLVKPLTAERFSQALARARTRIGDRSSVAAGVARLARDLGRRPDRLLVPERGRMVPVEIAAIDWIQAEGDLRARPRVRKELSGRALAHRPRGAARSGALCTYPPVGDREPRADPRRAARRQPPLYGRAGRRYAARAESQPRGPVARLAAVSN